MRRGRRRQTVALATCLLWLVAVEVLPNLHLARHSDDHTHAAGGAIVHTRPTSTQEHEHGGRTHRHAGTASETEQVHAQKPRARKRVAQLAFDDAHSSGHAAAGIPHHALAIIEPEPPAVEPLEAARGSWHIELAASQLVSASPLRCSLARGPPQA